jgi:ribose transport system permease protein
VGDGEGARVREHVVERPPQPGRLQGLRGRVAGALAPVTVLALVVVLFIVGNALAPGFASRSHFWLLLSLSSFLGIVAIGQTVVILTGGIDLSIAWVMTGAAVIFTGMTVGASDRLGLGLAAALGLGLAAGLLNGLGVAKLRISPIVMTLGMNSIFQSIALLYTNGTPFGAAPALIKNVATDSVAGIPIIVIFWAGITAVVLVELHATRGGRYLYAFGESPLVSWLSGIHNDNVVVAAYAASGLCAALTGVLYAGFSGTSFLGMGDQFVLPSIAAVVLGGTSILGGTGGYGGTVIGAFFLTVLTTVLTIINVSIGIRSIIYGLVIIAAVLSQKLSSAGGRSP